LHLTFKGLL